MIRLDPISLKENGSNRIRIRNTGLREAEFFSPVSAEDGKAELQKMHCESILASCQLQCSLNNTAFNCMLRYNAGRGVNAYTEFSCTQHRNSYMVGFTIFIAAFNAKYGVQFSLCVPVYNIDILNFTNVRVQYMDYRLLHLCTDYTVH